jgi:hypothetical protein
MNKRLLVGLSFLLFFPSFVSAQGLFRDWYEYLGIPEEYSRFPELLYFVLIPFLGTFAIIWGILTKLKIFTLHKVNILLSFVFAFALLYSGVLLVITFYLFQVGGFFGIIAFFILFFGLTTLYTYRRTGAEYAKALEIYEKYDEITKKRKKISKNLTEIEKQIVEKQKEHDEARDRVNALNSLVRAIQDNLRPDGTLPDRAWRSVRRGIRSITGRTPRNPAHARDIAVEYIGRFREKMRRLEEDIIKKQQKREKLSEEFKKTL